MDWTAISVLLAGAATGGGILTIVGKWLLDRRKQTVDLDIQRDTYITDKHRTMIDFLQKQLTGVNQTLIEHQKLHDDCLRREEELGKQLMLLRGELSEIRVKVETKADGQE